MDDLKKTEHEVSIKSRESNLQRKHTVQGFISFALQVIGRVMIINVKQIRNVRVGYKTCGSDATLGIITIKKLTGLQRGAHKYNKMRLQR